MKKSFLVSMLALVCAGLFCIEVGGHISQDTVWSPQNNPYVITSFLYVDAGVTLTIMPGTRIRCTGADKSSIYNFMWTGNTQPVSKMIIVNGCINAVGTPDMPITFDKYQPENNFRWGGIYIGPNAPISTFEFCEFRNAFFCDYILGEWSLAAIDFHNGIINVRSCTFENNLNAIRTGYLQADILLYDCKFISQNDTYPSPFGVTGFIGFSAAPAPEPESHYKVTIAKCYFTGNAGMGPTGYYMDILYLNNVVRDYISRDDQSQEFRSEYGSGSSYGNVSYNGSKGWGCKSAEVTDSVFARRNRLIKPINSHPHNTPLLLSSTGIGSNFVSDNYMFGCVQVKTEMANATTTYMYNNIIEDNYGGSTLDFVNSNPAHTGGQMRFYNNLLRFVGDYPYSSIIKSRNTSPFVYNNTFIGYETFHWSYGGCDEVFTNNIIECTRWSSGGISLDHYPTLINNCLPMPLLPPWDIIDGGGNIVADPMFADTLNADYSLSAGSPCIDAGAYRPDLPDFDIRYHQRVVPGSVGGPDSVDIGAYEYNSVYIGGINGYVYDALSGLPIDCVKIDISGKLPEFSDTLGCFQYPSGAGIYTVKASRWDYEDLIIPNVQVSLGEETQLAIALTSTTVANDDAAIPPVGNQLALVNHPNPFRNETRIGFVLPESGHIQLAVYNIKGQKIKTIVSQNAAKGHHSLLWDGKDSQGRAVGSGIYFLRLDSGNIHSVHRMMLIK